MTLDSVVCPLVLNKYSILVDVKSKRFISTKLQSRRVEDKAKKHKSPAKRRRVGIYMLLPLYV